MRRVTIKEDLKQIALNDVPEYQPIFAREDGKLKGMLVKETSGWIVKIGGEAGATGYHSTREKCLASASKYYEFFVEDF